jgi:hypothetical protein
MADFFRELTLTKERVAAWVFRLLIGIIGAITLGIISMAWGSLQDVKAKSETAVQLQWTAIGKINDAQQAASTALGVLTTKLDDHIKTESDIDMQLKDLAKDHEQRLRGLERPHG